MLARVARYEVSQDRLTDAIDAFSEAGKEVEQLDGFAGGYVLIDHEDGRTMTVTLWESDAALEDSEPTARSARNRAAGAVDGSVLSVEKFEVSLELGARMSGV
ncbi:MAG TPA: antibiotic biosynthesis monooxygenase [Gaiellaceae bacterium]|jgi:heme-degrading monooxygenase HmoA|nr:antibiotic biosynthesis monooxygenase [Gaiellaceae bacterium]